MKENSIGDRIEEKYTRYLNCETDTLELTIEEAIFILETDASFHYVEDLLQEAYKVILSDYKRVLQENEKLKAKLLDTLEGQKVIKEETPQYIKENYISKEKIEDKIRKLEYYIQDVISKQITMLQEILKESEE